MKENYTCTALKTDVDIGGLYGTVCTCGHHFPVASAEDAQINLILYAINSIIAYSPVHGKGGVLFCIITSRYTDGRTANWCGLARWAKIQLALHLRDRLGQ